MAKKSNFEFYDSIILVSPTGEYASNLKEFLHILEQSEDKVIFHHLYQSHIKYYFKIWDYPNDFANWAAEALEDLPLAEKLANLDPYDCKTVEEAKQIVVEIIEDHLWHSPTVPWVRPGFEFYFSSSTTIIMPLGIKVSTLKEFKCALEKISESSLYYHFYEGRKRHKEKLLDDFSLWIEYNFEKNNLLEKIREIDFYFFSLEEIRKKLIKILDQEIG